MATRAVTTRAEAEQTLAALGAASDAGFSLLEAGLSCALHEHPGREAAYARTLVEEAVDRLHARLAHERPEDALGEALGGDLQLGGDLFTPDDPVNADLISVCERRKGLSITLGLVYLEAGRRCALQVCGVDFPSHFLLRIETDQGPIALDPYTGGMVVLPSELTHRALSAGLIPGVANRLDALMTPVSDRQVISRLQSTLFAQAARARDYDRAERSALRSALLNPLDHRPWLDVAAAREGQGRLSGALDALGRAQALGAAPLARLADQRLRRQLN